MVASQIRDVPDDVRDELAAVAAERGISLQMLLREVIQRAADSARAVRPLPHEPTVVLESTHALRGLWLTRAIDDDQFDACVARLRDTRFDVWPTVELLPRVRQLAANTTAYDAAYVALAEDTGSVLLAADAELARIPGIRCRVIVAE